MFAEARYHPQAVSHPARFSGSITYCLAENLLVSVCLRISILQHIGKTRQYKTIEQNLRDDYIPRSLAEMDSV